jgi:hypothetical protein
MFDMYQVIMPIFPWLDLGGLYIDHSQPLGVLYLDKPGGRKTKKHFIFCCEKCAKMNSTYSTVSKIGNI